MNMDSIILMSVYVKKTDGTQEEACSIEFQNLKLGFSAIIDSMVLRPKVLTADVGTIA